MTIVVSFKVRPILRIIVIWVVVAVFVVVVVIGEWFIIRHFALVNFMKGQALSSYHSPIPLCIRIP